MGIHRDLNSAPNVDGHDQSKVFSRFLQLFVSHSKPFDPFQMQKETISVMKGQFSMQLQSDTFSKMLL